MPNTRARADRYAAAVKARAAQSGVMCPEETMSLSMLSDLAEEARVDVLSWFPRLAEIS